MTQLTFKRDDLIEALEARREWANRTDLIRLKAHKRVEQEYLKAFKAAVKVAAAEVVKWTYEDAKKAQFDPRPDTLHRGYRYGWVEMDRPDCPSSRSTRLNKALATIQASRQQRIVVSDGGQWATVFFLLTHDDDAGPKDVC